MAVGAITFDFWCTLFGDSTEVADRRRQVRIDALTKATGATEDAAKAAHKKVADVFMRHHIESQRTLGPPDALAIMAEACGVTVSKDCGAALETCFAEAILAHPPVPMEGALEAVRIAAQERPVGIISDSGLSPGSSLSVLLDRNGFTEYLTATVFSDEVGVAKPQAPMFEKAAAGLGVKMHDLLHIGDLEPTDIDGALAVGATAGLYIGFNDKYLEGTKAHHTFPTWQSFIDVLPDVD
jgi:putative hydrolase of the HAD superfamily